MTPRRVVIEALAWIATGLVVLVVALIVALS
jgi:hypothetical protein